MDFGEEVMPSMTIAALYNFANGLPITMLFVSILVILFLRILNSLFGESSYQLQHLVDLGTIGLIAVFFVLVYLRFKAYA